VTGKAEYEWLNITFVTARACMRARAIGMITLYIWAVVTLFYTLRRKQVMDVGVSLQARCCLRAAGWAGLV